MPDDHFGALRVGPGPLVEPTGDGPLHGLDYVAKDVFDVAGEVTGAGNPTRLAEEPRAARSAEVVELLAAAGARCIGKSHTDEFAFSLAGIESQSGSPRNPVDAARLPGGSSSGSAVAVASGLVPFALGTDTGGSVRVPASYCGIVGLRTTHGAVSRRGMVPLSASFDTVGWFGHDVATVRAVAGVLLAPTETPPPPIRSLAVLDDARALVGRRVARAFTDAVQAFADARDLPLTSTRLPDGHLSEWVEVFRTIQMAEAYAQHRDWFEHHPGALAPGVEARLVAGAAVTTDQLDAAREERDRFVELVTPSFDGGSVALVLPSAIGPAPLITDALGPTGDLMRLTTLQLTCTAGLLGAPGLGLPLATVDDPPDGLGLPVGVGLVGRPGSDLALLDLALPVPTTGS
jgi:amidase